MIAIIDYGVGNLFSVQNALRYIGEEYVVTAEKHILEQADGLILPGVGAFPYAMNKLRQTKLVCEIRHQAIRKPLLGICLGMQMLFDQSNEFEPCDGLGLIPGKIEHIPEGEFKIPHMGWNQLRIIQPENPLLHNISSDDCVYFVHSYYACTEPECIAADCSYGVQIPALVCCDNSYGVQFHPEKSGEVGLQILRNFGELLK